MSRIFRIPKSKKPNAQTEIIGGKKLPADPEETKIYSSSATRARAVEIEATNDKGDKVVVKTHTRSKPKGNS